MRPTKRKLIYFAMFFIIVNLFPIRILPCRITPILPDEYNPQPYWSLCNFHSLWQIGNSANLSDVLINSIIISYILSCFFVYVLGVRRK